MRRHKYKVRPKSERTWQGIIFDSVGEMKRYIELCMLRKAGQISSLEHQVKFVLVDGFSYKCKNYREVAYVADFKYQEGGITVVEDFKGFQTDVYKLKRKMFLRRYGGKYQFRESRKNGQKTELKDY